MNAPFAVRPLSGERTEADELLVAPSRERRRLQCYLALVLGDILSVIVGFGVIGYLFVGRSGFSDSLVHAQLILPIYLTLALYNGSYSISSLREGWVGIFRAMIAMIIAMAVVVFVQFLIQPAADVSRSIFNGGAFGAMLAITWTRLQLRSFVTWRCGANVMNELVIDDGGPQLNLQGAIRVSAAAMGLRADLNDPHALDRLGLVLRNIDRVIVSCPAGRRADWAMMLKGANVDGEVLDDEVARLGAQGARVAGKHGLLLVSAGPLGLRDRAIKRLFDVTFAGLAIIALSPLLLAVALAVKLQDGGPVFFMQKRMGRGNRFFNMYKFRSMTHSLCDKDGNQSASKDDQRITRVGKFIRRTSIDELPQLFNVLLGDMSLVGPRPHATGSLAGDKLFWEVDLRYWQRHCLKPGLSGLAQVRGYRGATDHESDLQNRLQSDLEYLEGWTIMRDLQIIFLTLRVLVHDRAF
ncbi:exopolysaccharide biosynthesis polyprenyl glycosylphosphotransferase [Novosphingobium naphthalenivorans]|uniref:exopolysaccharide biosynthesis polyprenyl glycosylphosphotransferase n=1 Tax=Novosphingobium naphthalenivorans TaxID=273168 RepID=UPI000831C902|nr:exopolysaccharide biosynthesis polyprenyl glycosylphosphotransferase [Novosphingobium naphthalenivorans]